MFIDLINPIHTIILVISIIGIIISFVWAIRYKRQWRYIVAPFSYLLDVFLYNVALHLFFIANMRTFSAELLETWSGVVRLHSLLLIIALIILQPLRKK